MTCDLEWELAQIVGEEQATQELCEELSFGREVTDDDEEQPDGY